MFSRRVLCGAAAARMPSVHRALRTIVDFRSDTVTRPTAAMCEAMVRAPVGDDVFCDDPTVQALERRVADMLGKEAGLFCASGTMGNQLALRCHLNALESVVLDRHSHVFVYENGGVAYHSQAQVVPVDPLPGAHWITADQIEQALVPVDVHKAPTTTVSLENALGNGCVMPMSEMAAIAHLCRKRGLRLHLDGARLWNAAVALGVSPGDVASHFDTVSVCLSKGLGAPIGSVLVGSTALVARARNFRKLFGGGWRQAGVLAAAGMYALDHHLPRVHEDHENAKHLAARLQALGFPLVYPVCINMAFVGRTVSGKRFTQFAGQLAREGFLVDSEPVDLARIVCHLQTPRADIDRLVDRVADLLRGDAA